MLNRITVWEILAFDERFRFLNKSRSQAAMNGPSGNAATTTPSRVDREPYHLHQYQPYHHQGAADQQDRDRDRDQDYHRDQDYSSGGSSSPRTRYAAMKDRRQRLARSRSSHNFGTGEDLELDEEPVSPSSQSPSAYLAAKYGPGSELARSRSTHALKSREASPDRERPGAEKDGAALSSWARYLKNKYGNRNSGGGGSGSGSGAKDKEPPNYTTSANSASSPSSTSTSNSSSSVLPSSTR